MGRAFCVEFEDIDAGKSNLAAWVAYSLVLSKVNHVGGKVDGIQFNLKLFHDCPRDEPIAAADLKNSITIFDISEQCPHLDVACADVLDGAGAGISVSDGLGFIMIHNLFAGEYHCCLY